MIRFTLTVSLPELKKRYGDQYPILHKVLNEVTDMDVPGYYDVAIDWFYTDPKDKYSHAIDEVLELYFKDENTTVAYGSPVILLTN